MKKIVVIGGRLQGLEALYLAKKAGIYTTLIDKDPQPIGQNFCNSFICKDVIQYGEELLLLFQEADFVLPAFENKKALQALQALRNRYGFNLLYDERAYGLTSSKILSDEAMAAKGIPIPCHYPGGKFPYIAKPSIMSGSEGVCKLANKGELTSFLGEQCRDEWVIEEYLEGPSYSLEIIGVPGHYRTYHITELLMDKSYDCKRVLSRPDLPEALQKQFQDLAISLAEMVSLHGIMDVEVIDDQGVLKVLEIDARLPSQTPINIFHATGVNFIGELHRVFCPDSGFLPLALKTEESYVSLEQIAVSQKKIEVLGEHILTTATGLHLCYDFFGADEAMTDYQDPVTPWVATVICKAHSSEALAAKRKEMFAKIAASQGSFSQLIDV